jgi:TRAP-type C4-dicarboxylate transport system substrate-binding protein
MMALAKIFSPGGPYQRLLHERSNGRIELDIIGDAFPMADVLEAVGTGKIDMGEAGTPYLSATYPLWAWEAIPGILSEDRFTAIYEQLAVYLDPTVRDIYDKTFREVGAVFLLADIQGDNGAIWSTKKVTTVNDLKGLKLRATAKMVSQSLQMAGASPVTIGAGDFASAVASGVVDGVITGIPYGWDAAKMHTLTSSVTVGPFEPGWTASIIMNAEKFDALPADLQQILREVSDETAWMVAAACVDEQQISAWALAEMSDFEYLRFESGEWDKLVKMLEPMRQVWLDDVEASGSPYGPAMLDAIEAAKAEYHAFETHP